MKKNIKNIISISGLTGSIIISMGSLITALFYHGVQGETYSFFNHYISELGQYGVSQLALLFNVCLIIGGLCLLVFMVSLGVYIKKWYGYFGAAVGAFAAISCSLVGVFSMNNMALHTKVAMSFFNGGLVAILIFTLIILFDKQKLFSKWLAIPGALTVLSFALFLELPKLTNQEKAVNLDPSTMIRPEFWLTPILEWSILFTIIAWIVIMSIYLLRKNSFGGVNKIC